MMARSMRTGETRHDEGVKFVRCPISECRETFIPPGICNFRTETSQEAAQDTTVTETANYLGGLPGFSEISDIVNLEYIHIPGYDFDYVELFADSSEFDEEFLINVMCEDLETVEEICESIIEMYTGIDECEPFPSSSGLSSDKAYNEI